MIENGTMPEQRTITGTVKNIPEEFNRMNFHPPVIIMISPTVSLRDEISWLEESYSLVNELL